MGSTSNALDKGGRNFKKLYDDSDVTKRNRNGQTRSGLYSLFIPMEWNYEGYIDSYGYLSSKHQRNKLRTSWTSN